MSLNNNGDKIMWDVTITWISIFIYCIVFWVYLILGIIMVIKWLQ
jgi:hypothetical protein